MISFFKKKVVTRFAPSPTGFLHVGGLRTALYNYLFAKQCGGKFLLRIEDTDRARLVEGAEEEIIKTLNLFGLDSDEKPLRQSERIEIYKEYALRLVGQGNAYEDNGAIRFRMPKEGIAQFTDIVRGIIEIENKGQEDFVVLKSDGYPTYNLAHIIDDHETNITHVIRGEEFIASMPKYIALHKALGWELPQYAHLPLLLNIKRAKLSKREGEVAVYDFLDKGYFPEAVLNFVALLGWHPKDDQEIFSFEELKKKFKLEDVQKGGAVFDVVKLDWMNREYIKQMPLKTLFERVKDYGADADRSGFKIGEGGLTEEKVLKILAVEQSRITVFSELPQIFFMFGTMPKYDVSLLRWKDMTDDEIKNSFEISKSLIEKTENFTKENLEKTFLDKIGEGDKGVLLWPLRVTLSGKKASPGPFEIMEILGKEETLNRLKRALTRISQAT